MRHHADGRALCWTSLRSLAPVPGDHRFKDIDAGIPTFTLGRGPACGIDDEGRGWCWNRSHDDLPLEPTLVSDSLRFIELRAAASHVCGISVDNDVYCGDTNGGKGDPVELHRLEGLPPSVSLTTGQSRSCAVAHDGRTFCWGQDHEPEAVVDAPPFVSVDGTLLMCGLTASGAVFCWGGIANTIPPTQVQAPVSFRDLGAGELARGTRAPGAPARGLRQRERRSDLVLGEYPGATQTLAGGALTVEESLGRSVEPATQPAD